MAVAGKGKPVRVPPSALSWTWGVACPYGEGLRNIWSGEVVGIACF